MTTTRRAGLAVATIIATALLAACDPAASTTAAAPTSGTSNSTAPSPTATTADTAAALSGWYTTSGKSSIDTLTNDVTKVANDSSNPTAVKADCKTLAADIGSAQSGDPIPDPQAQTSWATALTELNKGATDCGNGNTSTGVDEIVHGTTDLSAVAIRISAVVGQ